MDEDEETPEEELPVETYSYAWSKEHQITDLISFATAQAAAAADYFTSVQARFAADSNAKVDQDEFQSAARLGLETIFKQPEV